MSSWLHALLGFFLGALAVLGLLAGLSDGVNWGAVVIAGLVAGTLGYFFGGEFIRWFTELWWWS